jgi:HEPN domain-containing protein
MPDKTKWVNEWKQKAENDLRTAEIVLSSQDSPTDTICFHAQQCAEKYLKSYLTSKNITIEKTHDLTRINNICIGIDPDFEELSDLYDMHDNVWEWVQDKWHGNYNGASTDGSAWESGDGSNRVNRGGGMVNPAGLSRSALRVSDDQRPQQQPRSQLPPREGFVATFHFTPLSLTTCNRKVYIAAKQSRKKYDNFGITTSPASGLPLPQSVYRTLPE